MANSYKYYFKNSSLLCWPWRLLFFGIFHTWNEVLCLPCCPKLRMSSQVSYVCEAQFFLQLLEHLSSLFQQQYWKPFFWEVSSQFEYNYKLCIIRLTCPFRPSHSAFSKTRLPPEPWRVLSCKWPAVFLHTPLEEKGPWDPFYQLRRVLAKERHLQYFRFYWKHCLWGRGLNKLYKIRPENLIQISE